jgi:hypothetical protein
MATYVAVQRKPCRSFRTYDAVNRMVFYFFIFSLTVVATANHSSTTGTNRTEAYVPSVVSDWMGVAFKTVSLDANGAPVPTIISRSFYVVAAAMYDAWAVYDSTAKPTILKKGILSQYSRNRKGQEVAISYAAYRALLDLFPKQVDVTRKAMILRNLDPDENDAHCGIAHCIGNLAANAIIQSRRSDNSNQLGNHHGSSGTPYSDYSGYNPVNSAEKITDPNRWQPIVLIGRDGRKSAVPFVTPFWGGVTPFALTSGSQYRPSPPPQLGSPALDKDIAQNIAENANLSLYKKSIIEYMRDGPQATSASGLWIDFGQIVSRRDRNDLDTDMKMFFGLSAVGLDAFISSWEAKRFYDSSRPWTLIHYLFTGKKIRGWGGPGQGTVLEDGADWHPYAPSYIISPPLPGYVSGHSTTCAASAYFLKQFTGSDAFGNKEVWIAGSATEPSFSCAQIQRVQGQKELPIRNLSCAVTVDLPTFSVASDLCGISRILGGYHIQSDNVAGAELGRKVAMAGLRKLRNYF